MDPYSCLWKSKVSPLTERIQRQAVSWQLRAPVALEAEKIQNYRRHRVPPQSLLSHNYTSVIHGLVFKYRYDGNMIP